MSTTLTRQNHLGIDSTLSAQASGGSGDYVFGYYLECLGDPLDPFYGFPFPNYSTHTFKGIDTGIWEAWCRVTDGAGNWGVDSTLVTVLEPDNIVIKNPVVNVNVTPGGSVVAGVAEHRFEVRRGFTAVGMCAQGTAHELVWNPHANPPETEETEEWTGAEDPTVFYFDGPDIVDIKVFMMPGAAWASMDDGQIWTDFRQRVRVEYDNCAGERLELTSNIFKSQWKKIDDTTAQHRIVIVK